MISNLTQNWWLFLVRGLVATAFGILAIVLPTQTGLALVVYLGVYLLLDGLFTVVTGIDFRRYFERWWAVVLEGIVGIVVGVLTLIWPTQASYVLVYLIAAWAVLTGILELVASIQYRALITGEWSMMIGGILSIVFGIVLFVFPSAGLVSLVWLIGIYAVVFGITMIIFSSRLHGLKDLLKPIEIPTA